jgi:hypothetical protein
MNIAMQWIQHIRDINNGIEPGSDKDIYFSATCVLDEYCRNNPDIAWQLIFEIFEKSENDELILESLGSGPLEDLLAYHGDAVIGKLIELSKKENNFKNVISYVWRNRIKEHIWMELKNVVSS